MGTRSRIGVMHGDVVKHIYCHWDGYLAHNGATLLKHYDSTKANNLVALGDISSLRPEIGEQHSFDAHYAKGDVREDWCVAYGRDRGETGTEWKVSHTFEDFLEAVDGCCGEWYYIMKDGEWYCGNIYERDSRHYRKLVPLRESLEIEQAEEAA